MALALTFFPDTLTTNAVWFGCDLSERKTSGFQPPNADGIRQKLSSYDGAAFHPMLLPTVLADYERDRLVKLVRNIESDFVQKVFDLQYRESQQQLALPSRTLTSLSTALRQPQRSLTHAFKGPARRLTNLMALEKPQSNATPSTPIKNLPPMPHSTSVKEPSIQLFVQISHLRTGLGNWRAQLVKMIDHVDELQYTVFDVNQTTIAVDQRRIAALALSGVRIRARLQELVDEYDEFIRKCTHVMEGIMLATQLVRQTSNSYLVKTAKSL